MTSSETSSTPYWSQISRTRAKYPGGGGKQPPEFCTGSRNTAATESGPSRSIVRRPPAERLQVAGHEVRCPVEVGVRHPHPTGHHRLERLLDAGEPSDRER